MVLIISSLRTVFKMADKRYHPSERYKYIDECNRINKEEFDWEHEGVLRKCLPKILFKGNTLLVSFLEFIDMRIIILMQAITYIKHFKDISCNL